MIKPARGYILVEPIKDNDKTSHGVYLPEASKDKPMKGKVIAVGANLHWLYNSTDPKSAPQQDCEAKVDDTIYYKKWGNDEVKEGQKEYVFLKFEDVLGIWHL